MEKKMKNKVMVLMSTYNGEKFIDKQLKSILCQKDVEVEILVRDDGSTDNTLNILKKYKKKGFLDYYCGKNLGPAKSFMELINSPKVDNKTEFFAFSDQDDIWREDKLKRAVDVLNKPKYAEVPSLYASNFQLVDSNEKFLKNINHIVTTTFLDSIVISSCTGCTMVFNSKLMNIIKGRIPDYLYMHDDWIHKVCLAIGGKVFFDKKNRTVYYRQHGNNVLGIQEGLLKKLHKKISDIVFPKYKDCMLKEYAEIKRLYYPNIPEENKEIIDILLNYKSMNFLQRIFFIRKVDSETKLKKFSKDFKASILFKRY